MLYFVICAGSLLTKVISIFLERTNIISLKCLTTANLHLYSHYSHAKKFENHSHSVDKQVIRMQMHEHQP